jgi:hypothetical protein
MADFLQLVTMLREQMNATLSRSDVLKPLAWLVGMLALGVVLMVVAKAPDWVLQPIVWALMGSIILYICAYTFCLFVDRDALRSEKYSLNKMAIEHGLIGDSSAGLFEKKEASKPELLAEPTKQIELKP